MKGMKKKYYGLTALCTFILIQICLITAPLSRCVAVEKKTSSENLFFFPVLLHQNGDYYRSISEILKLKFKYPNESIKYKFDLYLLKNYYYLNDFENAEKTGHKILFDKKKDIKKGFFRETALFYSKTLLELKKPELAEKAWLSHWNRDDPFPSSKINDLSGFLDSDQADLYSSVLPGSGLFYSGEYQKGIVSFLINTLFITGAYSYWSQQNYGIAGILMFFEIGWYFGGKNASIEAVENHNSMLKKQGYNHWFEDQLNTHFKKKNR